MGKPLRPDNLFIAYSLKLLKNVFKSLAKENHERH